jgi:hypothetical protein
VQDALVLENLINQLVASFNRRSDTESDNQAQKSEEPKQ